MPQETIIETEWLTEAEAAVFLGMSRKWLQRQREMNTGPPVSRFGDGPRPRVRYSRTRIAEWALAQEHDGA